MNIFDRVKRAMQDRAVRLGLPSRNEEEAQMRRTYFAGLRGGNGFKQHKQGVSNSVIAERSRIKHLRFQKLWRIAEEKLDREKEKKLKEMHEKVMVRSTI